MPLVVICFLDGELLHAEVPDLDFDLPVLEAAVRTVDHNSEQALIPLTGVRRIIVGGGQPLPSGDVLETWDRAVFRYLDGQVLRARIAPDSRIGVHGGIWDLVESGSDRLSTVAIPFATLKGVFQVRHWDSRPLHERARGRQARTEQLVRLLAERESRSNDPPQESATLIGRRVPRR